MTLRIVGAYIDMRWGWVLLLGLGVQAAAQQTLPGSQGSQVVVGQPQQAIPAPQHEANFDEERRQANELWLAGKHQEALPLYEDLCRQDQTLAVFAERHGLALWEKAATTADPKQRMEIYGRGLGELNRAQRLGDNSPLLVQTLYTSSKTPLGVAVGAPMGALPLTPGYMYHGSEKAAPLLLQGETAFQQQNLPEALRLYTQAAEADPQWYMAALDVGDTYFQMKDWKDAGVWFAKAVAIDPDRETAYRYWADALMGAGDRMGAKAKYIDAIVAEPYTNTTWMRLAAWAQATKTPFVIPRVQRPNYVTHYGKLDVDPALETETGDGHASWLVYEQVRVAHGGLTPGQSIMAGATKVDGEFTPNGYVHTLDEETDALNAMMADVQKKIAAATVTEDKLEPGIKTLLVLQKQGFLEAFVLLNFHDAGLRHGYPAYRAGHREALERYLNTVVASGTV